MTNVLTLFCLGYKSVLFSNYFSQYAALLSLTFFLERKRFGSESQHFLVKLGYHEITKIKWSGH